MLASFVHPWQLSPRTKQLEVIIMANKNPAPGGNLDTGYGTASECRNHTPYDVPVKPSRQNRKQKRSWRRQQPKNCLTASSVLRHSVGSLKNVSSTPTSCCEVGFFSPLIQELRNRAISAVMGVLGSRKAPAALTCCESTPTLIGGFLNLKNVRRHHA